MSSPYMHNEYVRFWFLDMKDPSCDSKTNIPVWAQAQALGGSWRMWGVHCKKNLAPVVHGLWLWKSSQAAETVLVCSLIPFYGEYYVDIFMLMEQFMSGYFNTGMC